MEGDKTKKSKGIVKDYNDMSTDKKVDVEIIFNEPIDESMDSCGMYNKLEKTLKLYTTQSTNNMHLFNHEEKLSKYSEVEDILNAYVPVRLDYYQKRKDYQIQSLEKELKLLSNKAKYIDENLKGTIDLRNKKKDIIIKMLQDKSYDKLDDDNDYKYLLKMPMDSVSEENSEKIKQDKINKETDLEELKGTSIEYIWLKELNELKEKLLTNKTMNLKKIKK